MRSIDMEEHKAHQNNEIRLPKQLSLYFSISLGIFMFVLFYEPFSLTLFESNDMMLFYAGFGGITFLFLSLFLIVIPWLLAGNFPVQQRTPLPEVILQLLIWITSSVAFAFYIRYVGHIKMSMFMAFKIALICFIPPVIVRLDNLFFFQKQQIKLLNEKYKKLVLLLNTSEGRLKQTETFISENKNEKISLQLEDIIVIKSADNYIDIAFREGDSIKHRLIRNTLRNVDAQLSIYPDFVRCHRTCIVNIKQTSNLFYSYKGYRLLVPDYNEEIMVSRQYLMKVREVMTVL